jgi:hypothetical protein
MLFSGLPPAGLAAIIDSMQPQLATAGREIIKQVCTSGWGAPGQRARVCMCGQRHAAWRSLAAWVS